MTNLIIVALLIGAVMYGPRAYRLLRQLDPARFASVARIAGGIGALALAGVLTVRGLAIVAWVPAAIGSWLLAGGGGLSALNGQLSRFGFGGGGPRLRVTTDTADLMVDQATGALRGRVLKGVFRGRGIETMAPAEIAILWRDCRNGDPKVADVLAAHLDRRYPTWRDDMARAEAEPGAGGLMTEREALDILGLSAGANVDDIRRAHRALIVKLHPDRGGSNYLTARINEAKDVLLKGSRE